jgi:hypothetical protein
LEPVRIALELERDIVALKGVRAARVEPADEGVGPIRVLAFPDQDPETVVACVREIASREHSLRLDPAQIRVLKATERSARHPRRRLASLMTERYGGTFKARVTLDVPGDVIVGEKLTPTGEMFELRSIAGAVLDGLAELLDFRVELETAEVIARGADAVAVVFLVRETDRLVGTALVRSTEHDAVARATLDALNRFLGRTQEPDPVSY